MSYEWAPHPRERMARSYIRAHRHHVREPADRVGRGGFGYPDGFHGAYAERPQYATPRGELRPPRPGGSGWPAPIREISQESETRHRRAHRDRELAREVAERVFAAVGSDAYDVAVYSDDGVITMEGRLRHPSAEEWAVRAACGTPGVRWVRTRLRAGR